MNLICYDDLCHHISPEKIEIVDNIFISNGERFTFTTNHKLYENIEIPLDWEPQKYYYNPEFGWRLNQYWSNLNLEEIKKLEIKVIHLCKILYDNGLINDVQMRRIIDE